MEPNVIPFDAPLGAEFTGVDLRELPTGSVAFAIVEAFHTYHVLLFRDQRLDDDDLLEIADLLGPRYAPPPGIPIAGGGDQPAVLEVSNRSGGFGAVGPLPPHSDLPYTPVPPMAALLYALEVPDAGGETSWANLHRAYDELSIPVKAELESLRAVVRNPFAGEAYGRALTDGDQFWVAEEVPEFPHPIVRTHPVTGRRSLYFSPFVEKLEGDVAPERVSPLIAELSRHVDRESLYCTHRWRAGDLVIWDNRCTNHKRAPFDTALPRVMHRVQIAGTRPF